MTGRLSGDARTRRARPADRRPGCRRRRGPRRWSWRRPRGGSWRGSGARNGRRGPHRGRPARSRRPEPGRRGGRADARRRPSRRRRCSGLRAGGGFGRRGGRRLGRPRARSRRTRPRCTRSSRRPARRACRDDRDAGAARPGTRCLAAQPADGERGHRKSEIHDAQGEDEARTLGGRHGSPGSPMVRSSGTVAWCRSMVPPESGTASRAIPAPLTLRAELPRGARSEPDPRRSGSRTGRAAPPARLPKSPRPRPSGGGPDVGRPARHRIGRA